MSRLLALIACAFALAGCDFGASITDRPAQAAYQADAILIGADVASVINTGKTLDDHLIGALTDQDCSTVRA